MVLHDPYQRCKSGSKIFGPPKKSESDLDFGRPANIFLDSYCTLHCASYQSLGFFLLKRLAEHN